MLMIYQKENPLTTFAYRADPDKAALDQGLLCLLMIKFVQTLVDQTSNFSVLCTNVKFYIMSHSGWSLT